MSKVCLGAESTGVTESGITEDGFLACRMACFGPARLLFSGLPKEVAVFYIANVTRFGIPEG